MLENNIYSVYSFAAHISIALSEVTVKEYKNVLKHFLAFLNKHPSEIKKYDLMNHLSKMNIDRTGASFTRLRFAAIKKYYKYLTRFDMFDKRFFIDLFYDIELPKVRHRKQKIYLKHDVKDIIDIFENDSNSFVGLGNLVFLLIAATTGARRREIASLKICDINLQTDHITFFNTKNKKPRSIKLSNNVVDKIKIYLLMHSEISKDSSGLLFLNEQGYATTVDCIDMRIRKYAKKYGIKISFHAFRRGFATELSNNKVPIEKISKLLGHSSISMTASRYVYNDDGLDNAVLSYSFDDTNISNIIETSNILKNISNIDITNMLVTINNLTNEIARLTKIMSE